MMTSDTKYQTIWLSDIHLGCKDCKADYLLNFLENNPAKRIYLVGDIIDFWALEKRMYWPRNHHSRLVAIAIVRLGLE
ncbi:MAG: hypothetical protein V2I33_06560 [Kangiellaceae bacterium]|jgi:UDP-2,3-diacylglucosamine pyrophosphatase LpxH|nr:hypothetical protein [Kangiellaceae bacterium]